MATHDYIISNASGAAVRSDLNNALAAIVSNNSSATEPTTTYAYMWWADTTTGQLKLRNAANDGWVTLLELDGTSLMEDGTVSAPGLAFAADTDTGFYRIGANQLGIATNGTHAVAIDASQRVGIGIATPGRTLDVNGIIRSDGTSGGLAFGGNSSTPSEGVAIHRPAANTLAFVTDSTERVRIDGSGRLLLNTTTSRAGFFNTPTTYVGKFQVEGADSNAERILSFVYGDDNSNDPILLLAKHRSTSTGVATTSLTSVNDGDGLGMLSFQGKTGDEFIEGARIQAVVNGTPGTDDLPTYLRFMTTPDGGAGPAERVRIHPTGAITHTLPSAFNGYGHTENAANTGYSSRMHVLNCYRAATSTFYFANYQSGNGADNEFIFFGDGNANADGTWSGGGADYAEYFEWSDGNTAEEDRRGISVVLEGNKIREAVAGEDPIGVISGNPSVVGDAAWNKWSGKHLRDDFGTYILEPHNVVSWKDADGKDHSYEDWNIPADVVVPADAIISATDENGNAYTHRKVSPDYNPDMEYVPRKDRAEWDCVGLMGKLRIRKGQVTGARWIKMRDISDNVEEWLVR